MTFEFRNTEGEDFPNWQDPYRFHPQGQILKSHIERAVQDIFYTALIEESDALLNVFSSKEQIEELTRRMINYWESEEEYEKCSHIVSLGEKFKERWRKSEKGDPLVSSRIKEWLKSAL